MNELLNNVDKVHTTEAGEQRIRANLKLNTEDVALWCREQVTSEDAEITKSGKNWYVCRDDFMLTINSFNYCVITAHKNKKVPANDYCIRQEESADYRKVEELIRKAFWNVNVPGADEHYLAHVMREHKDYIKELALVLEKKGRIIGSIMYAKSILTDENGNNKTVLTFGPLSIDPDYQRKGYSRILLEKSFDIALSMGYDTIVIFGNPDNYISRGFKSCVRFSVSLRDGISPTALLVKELVPEALSGHTWTYNESMAYDIRHEDAEKFDEQFEPWNKENRPSQEEFFIHSHSLIHIR